MLKIIIDAVLGFLNNFFTNVFAKVYDTKEAEKAGALQAESKANVKVNEAIAARDAVKPYASPSELPASGTDPDFRD